MPKTIAAALCLALLASGCLDGECVDDDCLQRPENDVSQGFLLINATDGPVTWVFHDAGAMWAFGTPDRTPTEVFLGCKAGDVVTWETVPVHLFPTGRAQCGRGSVILRAEPTKGP